MAATLLGLLVAAVGCRQPAQPVDVAATVSAAVSAAVAGTLAAQPPPAEAATAPAGPTAPPLPTYTPYPTYTPPVTLEAPAETLSAPEVTATFLAGCATSMELTDYAVNGEPASRQVVAGRGFTIQWQLRNDGDCPWPAGYHWQYDNGQRFGASQDIVLGVTVEPGETITLTASLSAPAQPGPAEASWRLATPEGKAATEPVTFALVLVAPPTAPPVVSSPAPTVQTTATITVTQLDFNYFPQLCEYVGSDWRCLMTITPFGGGGGPYTVWVFDSEPPARYFGPGNQQHWIQSRRCEPYVHEIKVQDEPTGLNLSRDIFVSPADGSVASLLPGGACSLPD
jgi:hypothetical protein